MSIINFLHFLSGSENKSFQSPSIFPTNIMLVHTIISHHVYMMIILLAVVRGSSGPFGVSWVGFGGQIYD
jgi:hypothetical protein